MRRPRRNKAALIWEGEPGDRRTLTYWDLYREVGAFANVLKSLGVKRGDRVALYLPLIPELAIAMLACARIGAVHSVVFGGFSAESLRDRINDAQASLLVTADGGYRRGQIVPLKQMADEALRRHAVDQERRRRAARRPAAPIPRATMQEGRDHWYHELMQDAVADCAPEAMDAEDMLYILYTSGTTGKPKGIVHTTGGYLVGTYATTKWVFDLKEDDVYWCTADIGWVTGHSYVVYGPLANGATVRDVRRRARLAAARIASGRSSSATASRSSTRRRPRSARSCAGAPSGRRSTISASLRLLGSVGEPINPEAWMWYHDTSAAGAARSSTRGGRPRPGMIMITPLPGITSTKPGSATQAVSRHLRRDPRRRRASASRRAAACSRSPSRGRRCCAASTAIPSAS